MTVVDGLRENYLYYLDRLADEIRAYGDDGALWQVDGAIRNTAGNLCLHLAGNLEHFIGAQIGGTGYVRDRDAEFSRRDVPREELLSMVSRAQEVVDRTLRGVPDESLTRNVKTPVWDEPQPLSRWLGWLLAHLGYHVGQISYHRRLLDR